MIPLTFPYQEREHAVFGVVTRPVLTFQVYSQPLSTWFVIRNVLVDTGADISVFPFQLGQTLVKDVGKGSPIRLGRVVASAAKFHGIIHRIQAQIGDYRFEMPIAIAMSNTIPPILGRREALDRFTVQFAKGQELCLEV